MKRFLRWLLGIDRDAIFDALHENYTAMSQELQDARDAVDHLQRRFARLQVQVTRWAREVDDEELDDYEEDDVMTEIRKRQQRG